MKKVHAINRRASLKMGSLAVLGLAIPNFSFANKGANRFLKLTENNTVPEHFPNIPPEIIAEVVGKSHFDLDRVKELVDKRPELSRSVWEWRFGDFESAIGAASHVGRRDIALYLMSKGARPTVFTFAMLGHFQVIKAMVESSEGIQEVTGPHGISLLDHAHAGRRMKDTMTHTEIENLDKTIDYLTSLGNAGGEKYIPVSPEEQKKYLGNYKYGDGENEGFTIDINMRKLLSLGPIGGFGGALYKIGENRFTYNGAPSVIITFDIQEGVVKSLKLSDPDVTIIAAKDS
ncbi:MAG TPA: hypothetical protein PKW08_13290 [Flavobacteriaceae bacterium]|nr:hypothetical protein [Flavobacteriaceae bacterium]MCB9213735.1 hypothetical protein [Alteromonas sp.]HPF12537.1 hypothetical protein [Flavobacteriaceae bacterium]HQU22556.1 hypothetical protein [Flavobacteriaceae bacterium]HQU66356.1 hypothetical protein [Flavobacteriaceae bacterium]